MSRLRGSTRIIFEQTIAVIVAFTLIFSPLFEITQTAEAAFNAQINYQGKLTDTSNVAVADGTYEMEFKLYSVPTGGVALWTETLDGANEVQVTNGLFSVMLGSTTPLTGVDFNQTLYLGVNIEGDGEMVPRKILGTVPAAFQAAQLDGLNKEQFLRSDVANSTSTASTFLTISQSGAGDIARFVGQGSSDVLTIKSGGNIGIGTTSPYAKLSVVGPVVAEYLHATATTATSTFAGGLSVGNNGLVYDHSTGNVSIGAGISDYRLQAQGATNLLRLSDNVSDTDFLVRQIGPGSSPEWVMQLDATLTIKSGNLRFGSTTDNISGSVDIYSSNRGYGLQVFNNESLLGLSNGIYVQTRDTSASNYALAVVSNNGANNLFHVTNAGNVGIGTTSPYAKLSVAGRVVGEYFTATSSIASTFLYASTTALSVFGTGYFGEGQGGIRISAGAIKSDAGSLDITGASYYGYGGPNTGTYKHEFYDFVYFDGGFRLNGRLFDQNNSEGDSGYVLQSTGLGTQWVATSSLGFASASQIGSGLTGQFPYYAADGTTLTATSSIFLSSAGRVGIGTTSPYAKLSVKGLGTGTDRVFVITNSNDVEKVRILDSGESFFDGNLTVGVPGSDNYTVAIGGKIHLQDVDGNISVGYDSTLNGSGSVHVGSSNSIGTDGIVIGIGNTAGNDNPLVIGRGNTSNFDNSFILGNDNAATALNVAIIGHNITNNVSDSLMIGPNDSAKLTILSSGNIGIGTTSPFEKLSVQGNGYFAGNLTASNITATGTVTATTFSGSGTGLTGVALLGSANTFTEGGQIIDSAGSAFDNILLTLKAGNSQTSSLQEWQNSAGTPLASISATGALTLPSNGLVVGTNQLVVSGGNIGIGTSSPMKKFTVVGQSRFVISEGTDEFVIHHGPNDFSMFRVDGDEAKILLGEDGFGNIGISTSSPWKKLSVSGDMVLTGAFHDSTASAGTNGMILQTTGSATRWVATSTLGIGNGTFLGLSDTQSSFTANRIIHTNSAGTALTDTAGFVFTGTNLGIGTTSPYARLSVTGVSGSGDVFVVASSTNAKLLSVKANGTVLIGDDENGIEGILDMGGQGSIINVLEIVGSGWELRGDGSLYIAGGLFTVDSTGYTEISNALSVSYPASQAVVIGRTSGNDRGTFALDIQSYRDFDSQVASAYGAVTIGHGNTASDGTYNMAFGIGNTVDAATAGDGFSGAFGYNNTVTGSCDGSWAFGSANTASNCAIAIGSGITNNVASSLMIGPSDSAKLTILYTGEVGIGTTSPWAQLSVNPSGVSGPAFAIGSSTATHFVVTNGGNIGIGTASPTSGKVHIAESAVPLRFSRSSGSVGTWDIRLTSDSVGTGNILGNGSLTFAGQTSGADFAVRAGNSGDPQFILKSSGNIGIGTTTPGAKIHSLATTEQLRLGYDASNYTSFTTSSGGNLTLTPTGGALSLAAGLTTTGSFKVQAHNVEARNSFYFPNSDLLMYATAAIGDSGNAYTFTAANGSTAKQIKASSVRIAATQNGTLLSLLDTSGGAYFSSNVGIGTTSPWKNLSVSGDMVLTGALFDSSASAGTNGMVLLSTGSATTWVATSTLGLGGGASTFLSLSDTQSSFTANRIIHTNSAGNALTDTAGFVFTGTNLGIGTTSPVKTLAVNGGGFFDVGDGSFDIYNAFDVESRLSFGGYSEGPSITSSVGIINIGDESVDQEMRFPTGGGFIGASISPTKSIFSGTTTIKSVAGVTNMIVSNTGNVGIGTTSPSFNLSFGNDAAKTIGVEANTTSAVGRALTISAGAVTFGTNNNGGNLTLASGASNGNGGSDIIFQAVSRNQGSGSTARAATEVARFFGGNFGIGTTSPYAKLSVVGETVSAYFTATTTDPSGYAMRFTGSSPKLLVSPSGQTGEIHFGGNNNNSIRYASNEFGLYTTQNNGVNFYTSGTNRLTIANGGNVGIGTTSPYAKLSVVGQTVSEYFTATSTTATSTFAGNLHVHNNLQIGNSSIYLRSNATSTFDGGIDLSAGCFSVGGTCIGSGGGSGTVNSGTTGQFPYYAANGTTLTATSSLFLTTGGNIGVGTTSATAKLSIDAGSANTGLTVTNNKTEADVYGVYSTVSLNATCEECHTQYAGYFNATQKSGSMTIAGSYGVYAVSSAESYVDESVGVYGQGDTYGLYGYSPVYIGIIGNGNETGVYALNNNAAGSALRAQQSNASGYALYTTGGQNYIQNNLGIGTTSPSQKLSVTGNTYLTGGLGVGVVNTTAGTIQTTGNVTIGTSGGGDRVLTINTSNSNKSLVLAANATTKVITAQTANDTLNLGGNSSGTITSSPLTQMNFGINTNFSTSRYSFYGGSTEVFSVMASGNLGIGTTSPYAKLSVVGETVAEKFTATSTTATSTFSGGMTVDGDTLVVDYQSSKVGIGNSSPGFPLTFSASLGNKIALYPTSATGGYGFGIQSSLLQIFANNSVDRVGIGYGSSGSFTETFTVRGANAGIGTTSPWAKFSVNPVVGDGASPSFVIGSSTRTNFIVTNAGQVGIGTHDPGSTLDIRRANDSGEILRIGTVNSTGYFAFSRSASTGALSIQGAQTGFNNIVLAPTGGNVGIGTTSPYAKLSVTGTAGSDDVFVVASSTNAAMLTVAGTGQTTVNTASLGGSTILFNVLENNTSKFRVLSNQIITTVGINNTSGLTLQTSGLSFSSANTNMISASTGTFTMTSGTNNAFRIAPTYNQTSGTASNTDLLINRTETAVGSGAQYLFNAQVGGVSRFNITNTGNVGIGTTTPNAKLSIDQAVNIATTTFNIFSKVDGGDYTGDMYAGYFSSLLYNTNQTGTAKRYGIYTEAHASSSLTGSGTIYGLYSFATGHGAANVEAWAGYFLGDVNVTGMLRMDSPNGGRRDIYMTGIDGTLHFEGAGSASGDATLSANGTWTHASDEALKENIVDIKYGLADVMQLSPRSYTMKSNGNEQFGFVAQELELLIPEVVYGKKGSKSVDYGSMVALTVSAIQDVAEVMGIKVHEETGELRSERIDSLELRVTNIEELLALASSTEQSTSTSSISIGAILEMLGAIIRDGIAFFKNLIVEKLFIGTSENPSGITIYDEETGEPYCLRIVGGVATTSAGVCLTKEERDMLNTDTTSGDESGSDQFDFGGESGDENATTTDSGEDVTTTTDPGTDTMPPTDTGSPTSPDASSGEDTANNPAPSEPGNSQEETNQSSATTTQEGTSEA